MSNFDPQQNYQKTKAEVGYVQFKKADEKTYQKLGFMCGLEIHQQLKTVSKLFCRCPAGIYQKPDDYDAEVVRHMRPTLSELGEYDGTALMEFKTRKEIIYRLKNVSACTYDIDDTPPFPIDQQALDISVEIALLLNMNIVGELHITRKQYLDGSIPTGFQRTAIIGIEGDIPLPNKTIKLIQLSIEEDSCREVSDVGHLRIYRTDRLGVPLIEMVTYPDMKTPQEAAEVGHFLRYLARSTGKVNTGIGAARQDVNVSISGGTRVEIKGVAHIKWIPKLTHNEAFRQKSLLIIKEKLNKQIADPDKWSLKHCQLDPHKVEVDFPNFRKAIADGWQIIAVNLPNFKSVLSHFTQPEKMFADEISERLKVIACLENPNMLHSEQLEQVMTEAQWQFVRETLKANDDDAQLIFWSNDFDLKTAIETIDERCRLAMTGVPNETRKSLPGGMTIFERVLPGPDRMYPDTDAAPLPVDDAYIEKIKNNLPIAVEKRIKQLQEWQIPEDCFSFILKRNVVSIIEKIISECEQEAKYVGIIFGHLVKNLEGKKKHSPDFTYNKVYGLFKFVAERGLQRDIIPEMLKIICCYPKMQFDSVLTTLEYKAIEKDEILSFIPALHEKYAMIRKSHDNGAESSWIMGQLRKLALGNISFSELRSHLENGAGNG